MTDRARRLNRKVLLTFFGVFTLLFIAGEALLVRQERQLVLDQAEGSFKSELTLLGGLALEAMLRGDYASVNRLVNDYGSAHQEFGAISVVAANGFPIGSYARAVPTQSPTTASVTTTFQGREVLRIRAERDAPKLVASFLTLAKRFALAGVLLLTASGWLLWRVLRATAIDPLESEIAEHDLARRALERRTGELELLTRDLEAFNYSVAHDLRGPLRAILAYADLLALEAADKLDADCRRFLDEIRGASLRMSTLIGDMLALWKTTRAELTITELDLSSLGREIGATLAAAAPARVVDLVVAEGVRVRGDEGLMRIVLENLLGNAWKYTANCARSLVEFGVERRDGETAYFVRDNGAGFDMGQAEKMFEPFHRLHSDTNFPGTGIGLATVARCIGRLGGRAWAEGEVGKGATFYFTVNAI